MRRSSNFPSVALWHALTLAVGWRLMRIRRAHQVVSETTLHDWGVAMQINSFLGRLLLGASLCAALHVQAAQSLAETRGGG